MGETETEAAIPTHVTLTHAVFQRVHGLSFRRSGTDRTPVMVVPLGEREAEVPFHGLCKEFDIAADSPDGRMLALVAEALGFVTALMPGDKLPDEVASGDASWNASVVYRRRAEARLKVSLLKWLRPGVLQEVGGEERCAEKLDRDPELRTMVQNAFRAAAERLGLGSAEEVVPRMEQLAGEFAYIEALRAELLLRVINVSARVRRMESASGRLDGRRKDTVARVLALNGAAIAELQERFDTLDLQIDNIIALLEGLEAHIAFFRTSRNTLHRMRLGWQELLDKWDALDTSDDTMMWEAILETYQFLARRFLPFTEWPNLNDLRGAGAKVNAGMRW
jgi:hypothetical protein